MIGRSATAKTVALLVLVALGSGVRLSRGAEPAPASSAQSEAATHFRRGVELYDEGDHASALVEFRRAYAVGPTFRVLYNIGQAHYELRDYAAAFRAFRQYLTDGGERVPANRREQVENDLARLQQRVARIDVRVDVDGARVVVDDIAAGTSPLRAPVVVNLGAHRITARSGEREVSRSIEVAGGDQTQVWLKLGSDRHSSAASPRTLGYVLAGAGLVVLASALVSDLVLVPNAIDEFEARRARDAADARSVQSSVHTLQILTVVGYAGGAILAGVGGAIILWPNRPAATTATSYARGLQLQVRGSNVLASVPF